MEKAKMQWSTFTFIKAKPFNVLTLTDFAIYASGILFDRLPRQKAVHYAMRRLALSQVINEAQDWISLRV